LTKRPAKRQGKAPAPAEARVPVVFVRPHRHAGVDYRVGDSIEVLEDLRLRLVRLGAIAGRT
jgi:hypothetical protein